VEREADTIVCATGFDVSYRPRFPIVGKNGVDLADKWKVCPESYLGLAIPDFPNFITFIGPTWPVEVSTVDTFDVLLFLRVHGAITAGSCKSTVGRV